MTVFLSAAATAGVALTGLYLLVLGGSALARPELAKKFLGGFVSSAATHFAEQCLPLIGIASVAAACALFAALLLPRAAAGERVADRRATISAASGSTPRASHDLRTSGSRIG